MFTAGVAEGSSCAPEERDVPRKTQHFAPPELTDLLKDPIYKQLVAPGTKTEPSFSVTYYEADFGVLGRMKIADMLFLFPCKLLLLNQTLAFFNRHNLICSDSGHGIDYAAGPAYLDEVHRSPLLEAEMRPEIILRQVTAAAPDFVYLHQAS